MSESDNFLNCEACSTSNQIYAFIAVGIGTVLTATIPGIMMFHVASILDSMNEISPITWILYVVLLITWVFVVIPGPMYVWCGFNVCDVQIKSKTHNTTIFTPPTMKSVDDQG